MKQNTKKRFSVGHRVQVGDVRRLGTIKSVDDAPSIMGEFVHEVWLDGDPDLGRFVGCEIFPIPVLDGDLRGVHHRQIHIQRSAVANLNLRSQAGTALEVISGDDSQQREFEEAFERLIQAVLFDAALQAEQRQELRDVLSTLAQEAAKKPEERSTGILKAAVTWLPTALSAPSLTALWGNVRPIIKTYFKI
jgi:hypothetical protein